ncbi:Transposon Ty3-G Gag-Pol polyprotein [Sesamum angolense]|uniref:Transposon Ty3-G Gag-Pol polyprotein n=1 Tax=Sesamum angolense TaxID=2727404 RepID=A0AAE2C3V1_9LAMI|nr:Transposon Ty3-G Gag-Pol polyprotein [Sesamum angolense]
MRNHNNDTLVISAPLSNFWVKKVLVDSGSSADIIFYDAYVQLGVDNAQLRKVNTPLIGFSGEMIEPLGEVTLPLSLGSYPKRSTKMVKFIVVKAPSTYNIILGRPSLNLFRAIASTFHMKLKFPTSDGVGEAVGDERMKKRMFGAEKSQAIKKEVDKMLKAGYIRPVQYPEWLANVVLVPKANGKWRLCIDFTNLNKACPKDPFPLPRIDILVDSTLRM